MNRLLVFALIVAAVLSVGGARAYFTAQTEIKDNIITAGTVEASVEPTAGALSVPSLAPGQVATRTVRVTNIGVLPVNAVTTMAKKAGYTAFWSALQCTATCDGVVLYTGPVSAMQTAPVRIEPGQSALLEYSLSLPADVGNDLQGDYARASLYIDAEQAY
jgi:predicted ribosomally synthesized peptide with SipW-like signal peptide